MSRNRYSSLDRLSALSALGQARTLEWLAAAAQVALLEWAKSRRDWEQILQGLSTLGWDQSLADPWLKLADIAQAWCTWGVRQQMAMAHGLLAGFPLSAQGFSGISGRRGSFDPGRRKGAVVIDFPDRRKPTSPPSDEER